MARIQILRQGVLTAAAFALGLGVVTYALCVPQKWLEEDVAAKAEEAIAALKKAKTGDEKLLALERIQKFPDPAAVKPVAKLLDEQEEELVMAAARTLAIVDGKGAASALKKRLQDAAVQSRPQLAIALLEALGETGDPGAVSLLRTYRHNQDAQVVVAALTALGKIKDKQAVDVLIDALSHWERRRAGGSRTQQKKAAIIAPVARQALVRLTKQSWLFAHDWRMWWQANRNTFKFKIQEAGETGTE